MRKKIHQLIRKWEKDIYRNSQKKSIEGKLQIFKSYEKMRLSNNIQGNVKQYQLLKFPVRVGKMTNTADNHFGKGVGEIGTSVLGMGE